MTFSTDDLNDRMTGYELGASTLLAAWFDWTWNGILTGAFDIAMREGVGNHDVHG